MGKLCDALFNLAVGGMIGYEIADIDCDEVEMYPDGEHLGNEDNCNVDDASCFLTYGDGFEDGYEDAIHDCQYDEGETESYAEGYRDGWEAGLVDCE